MCRGTKRRKAMAEKPKVVKGAHNKKGRRMQMEIPVSLELVLLRAAGDEAFRDALLDDPERTLLDSGIEMRPSERAMLLSMSRGVLETMVGRFAESGPGRSRFAKKVATAAAGTLLVTAISCGEASSDEDTRIDAVGGVMPDMPLDTLDDPDVDEVDLDIPDIAPEGARPDMPLDPDIEEDDVDDEDVEMEDMESDG
jgi:hypothetical protein